jgi:hypothetical protein
VPLDQRRRPAQAPGVHEQREPAEAEHDDAGLQRDEGPGLEPELQQAFLALDPDHRNGADDEDADHPQGRPADRLVAAHELGRTGEEQRHTEQHERTAEPDELRPP